MAIGPGEYKSTVGVDNLYFALITTDSDAAFTPAVPERLAPVAEISQEPESASETQYADNVPYDTASAEGATKLSLTITNLPLGTQAKILGKVFDEDTGRMYDNGAEAPYVALLFRSLKSNGKYRYYAFMKGKFGLPKEEASTKTDKPEFKPVTLEFSAIFTTHRFPLSATVTDRVKRVVGDEDTPGFNPTTWFTAVPVPAYAP